MSEPKIEEKAIKQEPGRVSQKVTFSTEQYQDLLKLYNDAIHCVKQAKEDSLAFINQCDREGLGMQTITDHRKRIEKFLKQIGEVNGI